ncbi:MAG TPA: DUF364 domain-containing protein [Anaerolineales bacterium]|nr:DUF364 domain-containing protein [Anaerolineales bacterium]
MIEMNEKLIQSLLPGKILSVQVGLTRTAVLAETNDGIRCGLAATLTNRDEHEGRPAVQNAGRLQTMNYIDLASLIESYSLVETSIGLATINALLPRHPNEWVDLNAEDYLAEHGAHKNVAIVGHFPFVDRLRSLTQNLWVLELNPRDGDLPAQAAPEVVPQSDVLAITATTLINKTFQGLIDLCRPDTTVILVGPSAPLSPVMYDYGIDVLFGTIVTDPQSALLGVGQGISLRQLQQEKLVRLVTLTKGK